MKRFPNKAGFVGLAFVFVLQFKIETKKSSSKNDRGWVGLALNLNHFSSVFVHDDFQSPRLTFTWFSFRLRAFPKLLQWQHTLENYFQHDFQLQNHVPRSKKDYGMCLPLFQLITLWDLFFIKHERDFSLILSFEAFHRIQSRMCIGCCSWVDEGVF